jgi:hypothetical protein
MKVIITENKLEKVAIKWLNDNYGNLKPHRQTKYYDYIFYKKGNEIIFDINKYSGDVYVSDDIWSFLMDVFGMSYEDITKITKEWITNHYHLDVRKTECYGDIIISRWIKRRD